MTVFLKCALGMGALSLATASFAEPQITYGMNAVAVGRTIARCAVQRAPASVQRYLASAPQYRTPDELSNVLSACALDGTDGRRSAVAGMELRGLPDFLAEAYLRAYTGNSALTLVPTSPDYTATWVSTDPARAEIDRMALCIVAAKPGEATSLIKSEPGSVTEQRTIAQLKPALGACVLNKMTLKITRDDLRLAHRPGSAQARTRGHRLPGRRRGVRGRRRVRARRQVRERRRA